MPEDVTLGEIARRLEDVRTDIKDDIRELNKRLDDKVDKEVHSLEQAQQNTRMDTLSGRVTGIEESRKAEAERRAKDRRMVIVAIVIPIGLLIMKTVLQLVFPGVVIPG